VNQLGIVDAVSSLPLAPLLRARIPLIIASAVDGEPLVATSRRLAEKQPKDLIEGLRLAIAAAGAERGIVAVERRARDARAALTAAIRLRDPITVADVPDVARCGDARDLALDAAQIAVPPGDDPARHGALVIDAAALVELARGVPVVDRAITVAGGVAHPGVVRVPLGTSVDDVVIAAGGATCGPRWVALAGGPLAGRPLDRDDVITKASRALYVADAGSELVRRARTSVSDSVRRSLSACERCGMCTDVCPPRLLGGRLRPDELVRAIGKANAGWHELAAAIDCTACGLCDVACPSGISPKALVTATARALLEANVDRLAADQTRTDPDRDLRRLGIDLVARRLGLGERDEPPPWEGRLADPPSVTIPLKQSLGVAARPVVKPGDAVKKGALVAAVGEGELGVPMHASITGIVVEIAAGAIRIDARR
jgi:Na+-translocating ferredoxin:NAD+ oxidoreductase RnfC subunit